MENKENTPAKISFKGYKCIELTFSASEQYIDGKLPNDVNLNIDKKVKKSSLSNNDFELNLILEISSKDDDTNIVCNFIGYFSCDVEITKDFLESSFASINAPAILFPFIRAYISTVTINAGLSPIILPTINFAGVAPIKN
jgi:preprotein translocase subunit SecB